MTHNSNTYGTPNFTSANFMGYRVQVEGIRPGSRGNVCLVSKHRSECFWAWHETKLEVPAELLDERM